MAAVGAALSRIKVEAERLEVMDKAAGVLAELLYSEQLLSQIKEYRAIMLHVRGGHVLYSCCAYVTVPGKTDHLVIISDFEISVPHCSVYFALHNCAVRFAIAYSVPKLCESKSEHLINELVETTGKGYRASYLGSISLSFSFEASHHLHLGHHRCRSYADGHAY